MIMLTKFKQGFTLIELLVVIAIIGILIAVGTVNLVTAQKQARDARRQQDLAGIQTAFETYFAELQAYPINATQINAAFDSGVRPVDPKNDATYFYDWTHLAGNGSAYCICARLETKTGNADTPTSNSCTWNSTGNYFCIQNRQ